MLEKDFYLNLAAAVGPSNYGDSRWDGRIGNILTNGKIAGSISAKNLHYDLTSNAQPGGIVTRGPITASIVIANNLLDSSIIGSSITGGVSIGWMAQGSIVATGIDSGDLNAGHISSVQIGYSAVSTEYQYNYRPGLVGSHCPPMNVQTPEDWYGVQCVGGGTSDSVIHAESIGLVKLRSMSQVYGYNLLGQLQLKVEVPRVEAHSIERAEIVDMRAGVIWSGELEFDNNVVANDPENDFASIDELVVGCVGPGADIWFQGCERAEIGRDLFGEVHLPVLQDDETVWIGDRLGIGPSPYAISDLEYCVCGNQEELECFYTLGFHQEDSPRSPGYASHGSIFVYTEEGLQGQVIINGNNDPALAETGWEGKVYVNAVNSTQPIVLGPNESQPYEAPYYELPSGAVGGGAVGLAPFAFYPTDCTPPFEDPSVHAIAYDTFAGGATPVRLRWYGPVKLADGYGSANALLAVDCQDPGDECLLAPLSSMFNFVMHPDAQSRAVGLATSTLSVAKDGIHIIYWDEVSTARLACADIEGVETFVGDLPEQTTACVYEFTGGLYRFKVDGDCDGIDGPDSEQILNSPDVDPADGIPDIDDSPRNGILDTCEANPTCEVDWDLNGTVNVADIFAFLSDWFASDPSADFDGIGGVAVPDIFAFLSAWFATGQGPCTT